jgi:hypothetical protein
MNRLIRSLTGATWLAAAFLLPHSAARADGVVLDCTESSFLDALSGGGLVTFTQDCAITVTAPVDISLSTIIDAQGFNVTISGGGLVRIFHVHTNANLTLTGFTITEGMETNGAALYFDQGSSGLITNCTVSGNVAMGTNGIAGTNGADNPNGSAASGTSGSAGIPASGGAIVNRGSLQIQNCTFIGNSVKSGSGGNGGNGGSGRNNAGNGGNGGSGASALGGAILNLGPLTVSDSSFISNSLSAGSGGTGGTSGTSGAGGTPGAGAAGGSASGAGIYSTQRVTIVRCSFLNNTATGGNSAPGGTSANGSGLTGPTGGSTFGAGLYAAGGGGITNCTFFGNVATGGTGGAGGSGPLNAGNGGNGGNATGAGLYSTGTVAVVNCTFSTCAAIGGTNGLAGTGSSVGTDGSPGAARGGNLANGLGSFTLMNSIVASNLAGGNGFGTIIDGGNNISSDASISLSGTSKKNTDARIGAPGSNGGPTQTIPLLANSPAIDDTNMLVFPATDQRGVSRPAGKGPDIGAYEVAPPFISTQPLTQSQTNTGSVTLTVVAIGDPVLKYQWRYFGARIVGATASAYTIASLAPSNSGNYDVTVTNTFGGATSTVAVLTVTVPPTISIQPTDQVVNVGGVATFSVTVTGDAPLLYQWQFNGTNLPGATKSALTITNAQNANSGDYVVSITNDVGFAISSDVVLTVNAPPSINTQPVSQTLELGSPASFSVDASGVGPISYQWRLNGTNLPGITAISYSISAVSPADAGAYDVLVGNVYGSTKSSTATLTVTQPFIAGHVYSGSNGFPGVLVTAGTNAALTAPDGSFAFSNLLAGTYQVTPILTNYVFVPKTVSLALPPSPGPLNFSGYAAFSISGTVTDGSNPLSAVTVSADTNSAISDVNGNYTITGVRAGDYFVHASKSGYSFSSVEVVVGPSTNNVNFIGSKLYTVSGHVRYGTNGLAHVAVLGKQTTDDNGFFSLTFVAGTNVITPFLAGYSFRPSSIAVVNPPDATNVDFQAGSIISTLLRLSNGAVRVTVSGPSQRSRLQASSDLRTWVTLSTNNPPFQFTDNSASNAPVRFYRTSQP